MASGDAGLDEVCRLREFAPSSAGSGEIWRAALAGDHEAAARAARNAADFCKSAPPPERAPAQPSSGTYADPGALAALDDCLPEESLEGADERIALLSHQLTRDSWKDAASELDHMPADDLLAHDDLETLLQRLARCTCACPMNSGSSATHNVLHKLCTLCASEPLPELLCHAYIAICSALADAPNINSEHFHGVESLVQLCERSLLHIGIHWLSNGEPLQLACSARARLAQFSPSPSMTNQSSWLTTWCGCRSAARALVSASRAEPLKLPISTWVHDACTSPSSPSQLQRWSSACEHLDCLLQCKFTRDSLILGDSLVNTACNLVVHLSSALQAANGIACDSLRLASGVSACLQATHAMCETDQNDSKFLSSHLEFLNALDVAAHTLELHPDCRGNRISKLLGSIVSSQAFVWACWEVRGSSRLESLLRSLLLIVPEAVSSSLLESSLTRVSIPKSLIRSDFWASKIPLEPRCKCVADLVKAGDRGGTPFFDRLSSSCNHLDAYISLCELTTDPIATRHLHDAVQKLEADLCEGVIDEISSSSFESGECGTESLCTPVLMLLAPEEAEAFLSSSEGERLIDAAISATKIPPLDGTGSLAMALLSCTLGLSRLPLLVNTPLQPLVSALQEAESARVHTMLSPELEQGLRWLCTLRNCVHSLNHLLINGESSSTYVLSGALPLTFALNPDYTVDVMALKHAWVWYAHSCSRRPSSAAKPSTSVQRCIELLSSFSSSLESLSIGIAAAHCSHAFTKTGEFSWVATIFACLIEGDVCMTKVLNALAADPGAGLRALLCWNRSTQEDQLVRLTLAAELLVEERFPSCGSIFHRAKLPLPILFRHWIESAFIGVIPAPESARLITLVIFRGPVVAVAALVAIIHDLKDEILQQHAEDRLALKALSLRSNTFKLGAVLQEGCPLIQRSAEVLRCVDERRDSECDRSVDRTFGIS